MGGTVVVLDSPNPEHCSPVPKTKHMIVIDHHTKIEGWEKELRLFTNQIRLAPQK